MKKRQAGFTLMELMIVLSLAGVMLAIAAPNFSEFRRNNRLTGGANDFLGAVISARSEAIKQQRSISICPSSDPTAADPECGGDEFRGWIVFTDLNTDCVRQQADPDVPGDMGERIVRTGGPVEDAVNVTSNGECISFAPTGFRQDIGGADNTATNTIFCDDRGTALQDGTNLSAARGIDVSRTGRARITRSRDELTADGGAWPACG